MSEDASHAPTAEALLQLASSGSADAWQTLIEWHGETMWRAAYRVTRDEHLAADACQDALLRLRDDAHRFRSFGADPEATARGWLLRVATSSALQIMRSTKRRRIREQEIGDAEPLEVASAPSALLDAEHKDDRLIDELRREISALPSNQREALRCMPMRTLIMPRSRQPWGSTRSMPGSVSIARSPGYARASAVVDSRPHWRW